MRLAFVGVGALLLCAAPAIAQQGVLVEVYLVPTSARVVVEARVDAESSLSLPAVALHDLLGITMPGPWVALAALRHAFPTVVFEWAPEQMRVAVFDELAVLEAVKRFREAHRASAFGVAALPAYTGTFGGLAFDDQ